VKIDGTQKVDGGRANASPAAPARVTSVRSGVPEPLGSQVEISRSASKLQATGEVYDAERVAEIRQAIAEGRFQINPERIADGLLENVRDMLARRQSA
jgi:negative regulator of flagellin synthesis FlgM